MSLAVGSGSSIFPVNWRWLNIASLNAESHNFFSLDFLVYIVKGRDGVYRSTASLLAEEGEVTKQIFEGMLLAYRTQFITAH